MSTDMEPARIVLAFLLLAFFLLGVFFIETHFSDKAHGMRRHVDDVNAK